MSFEKIEFAILDRLNLELNNSRTYINLDFFSKSWVFVFNLLIYIENSTRLNLFVIGCQHLVR